jgi:peptide/nickel transport system substrate-binding protein
MNTTRPPFDDLDVRRAVNYAVNPAALERIYTGIIRRSQQVLPPGMPGHRHFELYPYDLRKAKRLIAKAHPKDRHVTVWGISLPPNQEAAEYYAGVLNSLGFETKLKTINAETYFGIIGNASTPDLDTGYANWLEEYPHPNDFFEPQLTGGAILPINNYNYSHFNDPSVDAKVDELVRQSLGPRQEAEYAALDEEVMRQAPWAPFGTLIVPTFVSSAIDLDEVVVSPIFGQDLSSFEFDESQN